MPGAAEKLVSFHHHAAAGENDVGHACYLNAFEHRVIHAHVVSPGADGVFALGVENHEIGVAADGDRSLARIQAKEFCRSRGDEFDESIHAETSLRNAAGINQAHAMLNAGTTVRNLGEIVAAEFFLLLETEWAMIGGDDLQMIALEAGSRVFPDAIFHAAAG